jgi:heme-degrading monooxygenase HmoA
LTIARIVSREGDQQEMERQYGIISGRMNELPLADGLKAHIALRTDSGIQVINVWDSEDQANAAMERPEFQEAMREAGVSREDMQPKQVEVLNVRTSWLLVKGWLLRVELDRLDAQHVFQRRLTLDRGRATVQSTQPSPQRHHTMTSQGTAHGRFQRAIQRRHLMAAEMAARVMGGLSLEEALSLCALMAELDPARYERAALRWLQRFIDERLPPLAEVALAASALNEVRHGGRAVGIETLRRLQRRF